MYEIIQKVCTNLRVHYYAQSALCEILYNMMYKFVHIYVKIRA